MGEEWWCQCLVPAGLGSGRETSTDASCQELLQNLTPLGTQRPPSRSGCQQTARGRGGGRILAGPKFWMCPKPKSLLSQSKGTAWFSFLLLKTVLCSWMKWGCPPPAPPGGGLWAGPAPRASPVAPGFLRWDPNSCSACPSPRPRHKLPLASPPPKIPSNASKSPQGLGNQTCPALASSLKSQEYKNPAKCFYSIGWNGLMLFAHCYNAEEGVP